MKIVTKSGVSVVIDDERGLLLNGKPPTGMEELGGGWWKASCVFARVVRAKKASGMRRRKKALMSSIKRYRFSFKFQREK